MLLSYNNLLNKGSGPSQKLRKCHMYKNNLKIFYFCSKYTLLSTESHNPWVSGIHDGKKYCHKVSLQKQHHLLLFFINQNLEIIFF